MTTGLRIPLASIASFLANTNTNTKAAYKQLYQDLNGIGALENMMHLEEDEILDVLKSEVIGDHGQSLEEVLPMQKPFCIPYVRSLTYKQVIILVLQRPSLHYQWVLKLAQ